MTDLPAVIDAQVTYLAPVMSLSQFKQQLAELKQFTKDILTEGDDYGVIPGTPKPTLLKPGAEKMLRNYGLVVDTRILPSSRSDVTGSVIDIDMEGTVRSVRSGDVLGTVNANCNSEERRYRNARDKSQQSLGDQKNTIVKMASKRVWVAAALLYTMASEIFSQDLEDLPPGATANDEGQQAATTYPCPKCKEAGRKGILLPPKSEKAPWQCSLLKRKKNDKDEWVDAGECTYKTWDNPEVKDNKKALIEDITEKMGQLDLNAETLREICGGILGKTIREDVDPYVLVLPHMTAPQLQAVFDKLVKMMAGVESEAEPGDVFEGQ